VEVPGEIFEKGPEKRSSSPLGGFFAGKVKKARRRQNGKGRWLIVKVGMAGWRSQQESPRKGAYSVLRAFLFWVSIIPSSSRHTSRRNTRRASLWPSSMD